MCETGCAPLTVRLLFRSPRRKSIGGCFEYSSVFYSKTVTYISRLLTFAFASGGLELSSSQRPPET